MSKINKSSETVSLKINGIVSLTIDDTISGTLTLSRIMAQNVTNQLAEIGIIPHDLRWVAMPMSIRPVCSNCHYSSLCSISKDYICRFWDPRLSIKHKHAWCSYYKPREEVKKNE